jgi:hypothetical protein
MKVIACRPNDNQFWIGCNEQEALNVFLPILSKNDILKYTNIIESNKYHDENYWNTVKNITETNEIFHAYFNVSRDAQICFPEQPHFPYSNMWDSYNPFRKIDQVDINSLSELIHVKMTYKGKEYDKET